MNISKLSPLYEYWNSEQDEVDEQERLLKINPKEPASNLFRNEPYKWENLYQSVVRNIIRGDDSSIKALMVLLSTLCNEEKDKCIIMLESVLEKTVIDKIRHKRYQDLNSSKDIFGSLKILCNIFLNPYGIEIKKDRNHVYENTGMFFHQLRMKLFVNK